MKKVILLTFLSIFTLGSYSAGEASIRAEVVKGPLSGQVLEILDGDTLSIKVHAWIGTNIETSVRIEGIDAPEIKGKCEKERSLAAAAKNELAELTANNQIRIADIRLEKYAGRVLAKVYTTDGVDISKHMLDKGLARPYHGEKRQPWCSILH